MCGIMSETKNSEESIRMQLVPLTFRKEDMELVRQDVAHALGTEIAATPFIAKKGVIAGFALNFAHGATPGKDLVSVHIAPPHLPGHTTRHTESREDYSESSTYTIDASAIKGVYRIATKIPFTNAHKKEELVYDAVDLHFKRQWRRAEPEDEATHQ